METVDKHICVIRLMIIFDVSKDVDTLHHAVMLEKLSYLINRNKYVE